MHAMTDPSIPGKNGLRLNPRHVSRWFGIALIPALFVVVVVCSVPLGDIFQMGGDEGYELIKATLMANGYRLYSEIWNDQPPLHSALLAAVFSTYGFEVGAGRALSVLFSALLLLAFTALVRSGAGLAAGWLAVAALFAWPEFLPQSSSVMIEIPSMALAVSSCALTQSAVLSNSRITVGLAGTVFALALETKLTAIIFLPVTLVTLCSKVHGQNVIIECYSTACCERLLTASWPMILRRIRCWGIGLAIGLATLLLLFPEQAGSSLWKTHLSAATAHGPSETMGFKPSDLKPILDLVLLASLSVMWLAVRRDWESAAAPLVFAGTVLGVHMLNRPFWTYYTIHFSMAAAWLIGAGIGSQMRLAAALWPLKARTSRIAAAACTCLVAGTIAWLTTTAVHGCRVGAWIVDHRQRVADAPVIEILKSNARVNRWVFTDSPIHAFHAGLLVPPEVAIVPRKRLWANAHSVGELTACLDRYRPSQILLITDTWKVPLQDYLESHYASRFDLCPGLFHRREE